MSMSMSMSMSETILPDVGKGIVVRALLNSPHYAYMR